MSEGLDLSKEDFCTDSLKLCTKSKEEDKTSDDYFDPCSWHSDKLSGLSSDGEDSLDALLALEDACDGLRATGSGFCTGNSKASQRLSVTAKDIDRDATETYLKHSSCKRRKTSKNHLDSTVHLKPSTRDQSSVENQTHPNTEKIDVNLNQEQSSLQDACTETQGEASAEPHSLHAQSQHNIDTFDTKVNNSLYTLEVAHHAQVEEINSDRLIEPTVCTTHTTVTKIVEPQQQEERLVDCNVEDVKVHNAELLSAYFAERNTDINKCTSGFRDGQDKETEAGKVQRIDKRDLGSVGTYCNHNIETLNRCVADLEFSVINKETLDNICTPQPEHIDSQLITEKSFTCPNTTEPQGTKTSSRLHYTNSDIRDRLTINVLTHNRDLCCSQSKCEKSLNRDLPESHPQVCNSVTPQDQATVSDVLVEHYGCVGTATKGTKPPGTVNEIHSSITFSTETTASISLDTCATELTEVPKVSNLASLVPLIDSHEAELCGRQLDKKNLRTEWLQPWQVHGQTQDLIPNALDQGCTTVEAPFHRQLCSVETLLQRAQTSEIQSDTVKGSEECLPHNPLLNNLLFVSGNQGGEDTSHLLSVDFKGERRRVGSPCSLQENKEWERERSHVYVDQEQTVEAASKADLQLQRCTAELSEHNEQKPIPKLRSSDNDFFVQHKPTNTGKILTCPTGAESIQCCRQQQTSVSLAKLQTTTNTISSNWKQVQHDVKDSESHCGPRTTSPLLSDSNNNTEASIKGVGTGEGVGCFSLGAHSSYKRETSEEKNSPLGDLSANETLDFVADSIQKESGVSLCSLDHAWSSPDPECLLKDFGKHCHLDLSQADENLRTQNCIEDNSIVENVNFSSRSEQVSDNLKTLQLGGDLEEEQPRDDALCSRRASSTEPPEDDILAEECREHSPVSLPVLHEVRVVRCPHPDIILNRLAVRSLEPIREAESSLENCGPVDDLKTQSNKEHQIMRPAEELGDIVKLSDNNSNPNHHTEQKENSTTELEAEVQLATLGLSEKQSRPLTVAYDAVSYSSASSNCDEFEDPHSDISDRNSNLDKPIKRSKTKGNHSGNKGSKFSVFAKMPSFRRVKGSKGSKSEDTPEEMSDRGSEGLPSEQGQPKDHSDEEVFLKGDIRNQTVQQTFPLVCNEKDEEDCRILPSSHHICYVPHLASQGISEVGSRETTSDNPLIKQVQSNNVPTCKRSKSNESLKTQLKKSLSSLFEPRSMDKENEEQAPLANDVESATVKQSWRKLKKAKETELLKRTFSVPGGEGSHTASGQECVDCMSSPLLDRLSNPSSPASLRAFNHMDPMPKHVVPQGTGREHSHGCRSEGQRRKGSPNGLPRTLSMSGLPSFFDNSGVPQANHTRPLGSPCPGHLSHLHSPCWTRSHGVVSEGLPESPVRPMSPKPNSPRPVAQRKIFRYPSSSRASSVSSINLGQSVSVEGLTDPPERPKTLKPSSSPLGVSLSPLDASEARKDNQSHISLYAIGFMNDLEVRKKIRKLVYANRHIITTVVLGSN